MKWLNENLGKVILSIVLIGLSIWHSDPFFVVLLVYGMGLYLIITKIKSKRILLVLVITIWAAFTGVTGLTVYVNYWMPHGPSYYDGNTCEFSDDGPCRDIYREDLSKVNIPEWAKFFRDDAGKVLWYGLLLAGILVSFKYSGD